MIEFERRFLVDPKFLEHGFNPPVMYIIEQGYVCADETSVVRIRSMQRNEQTVGEKKWFLTIKQNMNEVGKVNEHEFKIENGEELFSTLTKSISKTRYVIPHGDLYIEVDVFAGRHAGKIIAEVELANDEESQWLTENLPWFFGEEITGMNEYSNYYMCMH